MTLHEPATFATDCALAAWSVWLGARLTSQNPSTRWWRRTFFATAFAALAGGAYHGFGPALPEWIANGLWRATLLSIIFTSLCLTLATAHETLAGKSLIICRRVAVIKALVFVAVATVYPVFLSAIADYGSSMLFVLFMQMRAWRKSDAPSARWIISGVIVSALAAAIQQLQWAPSVRFNHNDLYHVIQMCALGLFQRGARASDDR